MSSQQTLEHDPSLKGHTTFYTIWDKHNITENSILVKKNNGLEL